MKKIFIEVSDETYQAVHHFCGVSNFNESMFVGYIFEIGLSSFNLSGKLFTDLSSTVFCGSPFFKSCWLWD